MNIKLWKNLSLDKDAAFALAEKNGLPFFLAMLLQIRGKTAPEDIAALTGSGELLSDPFLLKDMDKAAERIRIALDEFEKIAIYGDYDADGITATAILYTYLETCGADVMAYIPERDTEGYGMNEGAVRQLYEAGVRLIVTVDNGIASVGEVALATELGMDVVITDHHRPQGRLPAAAAVVDPHRGDCRSPYKDFSGCGVAFKLVQALEVDMTDGEELLEMYADLLAVGTIGDVMPVTGENRTFIRRGLRAMEAGERCGMAALLDQCSIANKSLDATTVAFTVVPRINAAGRMGSAARAVRLLTCEDSEEAAALAEEICDANVQRRQAEAEIVADVVCQLELHPKYLLDRILVVDGENWPHGVVGIAASKLTEQYGKPCIVISKSGEAAKGSGRSVEGFSLFDAVHSCRDLLTKYGGHPMAAGMSLSSENVPEFRRRLNEFARRIAPKMPGQVLTLDCKLNPGALRLDMPDSIAMLQPFGTGNPEPLFGLYDMQLVEKLPMGNGRHLRLFCSRNGANLQLVKFFMTKDEFPYEKGDRIDFAVTLETNEYRGEKSLSVIVKDMKPAGFDTDKALHTLRIYESFCRGEQMKKATAAFLVPDRNFFAGLYRLLRQNEGWKKDEAALISALHCPGEHLAKLLVALDVLTERGLIRRGGDGEKTFELLPAAGKTDLEASPLFEKIRQLCVL